MNKNITDNTYARLLDTLKSRVASARYRATLSVNTGLILLYHNIGMEILQAQQHHGWGAKIIDQLSHDLRSEFPESKGFSTRNLKYMRKFAEEYPDVTFVQQVVALLPWGHNVFLMDLVHNKETRIFYQNSRAVLRL